MRKVAEFLVRITEKILSNNANKKLANKIKNKERTFVMKIVKFLTDFVGAALIVFVINLLIFQAYVIPTGSMIPTVQINDHIFVEKIAFGPELIPALYKMPPLRKPQRQEIIEFENPAYLSKGPVFEVTNKIIFMLSLSLINLDVDKSGNPRPQFLLKRNVGVGGDKFYYKKGDFLIKPAGGELAKETDFIKNANLEYEPHRSIDDYNVYDAMQVEAKITAFNDIGLSSEFLKDEYKDILEKKIKVSNLSYDALQVSMYHSTFKSKTLPQDLVSAKNTSRFANGFYIPEGYFFPLGDNRDNSKDGRYFGPVKEHNLIGTPIFRFFPANRMGIVK